MSHINLLAKNHCWRHVVGCLATFVIGLALLSPLIPNAAAQESAEILFEQSTFAYARVDLERLDVDAVQTLVNKILGDDPEIQTWATQFFGQAKSVVEAIKAAGAKEIIATFSLNDLPVSGPSIFVSCSNEQRSALKKMGLGFVGKSYTTMDVEDGVIFLKPHVKDRISNNPTPRDDLAMVFGGHKDSTLHLFYVPARISEKSCGN